MRKGLLLGLLILAALSTVLAQTPKPSKIKKAPALVNLNYQVSEVQTQQVLDEYLELTPHDDLRPLKTETDKLGFTHEKMQQYYKGVKVEGATYTLHKKAGNLTNLSGNFQKMEEMNVTPALSAAAAFNMALAHVGASEYVWDKGNLLGISDIQKPKGELVIVSDQPRKIEPTLAYKFDMYASQPLSRAYVFVDAQAGAILMENQRIHNADGAATGNSLYNGSVGFTADNYSGGNYRLRQSTNGNGIETYDLNNGTNYGNASDITSSSSNFTGNATGVQAHYGAEQTYQYFSTKHGRSSYNGAGAVIRSYVSYSSNYVNAFWDGSRMTYGDGDGVNYGPLVSLDIVGHEIAHGVTEYTANLVYSYQSGALNESFSDIFGESIENYATGSNDWLMGDQIGAGGSGGALRSMSNPNAYGDPDTYLGTNWYSGSGDNGGVHYNSGVQNKWFYILTVGENGTNDNGDSYSVTGIGMDKAGAIAYRNLSVYLSSGSNYAAARSGAIQAAIDLYGAGSAEEIATTNAWYAVGVGAQYGPPAPCLTSTAFTLTILLDNYPGETTWTVQNGGTTVASGGPYSSSGSTVNVPLTLSNGSYTFTINDSYGDGICCSYGVGNYTLVSGGTTVASGGAFGSSDATTFCVDTGTPIPGCTDPNAHNYNSNATQDDGSCETCSDGVQNGDETGVDCGGAKCSACPVLGCTDPNAHNYDPNANQDDGSCETCSDGAQNGDETGIDCGGALCSACVNPVPGCTDPNAHNYDPAANQDDGSCETCSDGVQNGDETGVDCGGILCTTCGGGPVVLHQGFFESGWDGWQDGGSDCYRYSGSRSWEGSRSIRIRDNSGTSSAMTLSNVNLSGYSSVDIEFYFYPNSMENGEDFWVRYYDGSSWNTVATYARGTSFNNNTFYVATVTISSASYNFSTNAGFRFQCDASANSDRIYIDAVTITASSAANFAGGTIDGQTIKQLDTPVAAYIPEVYSEEDIVVYPNPTTGLLNIDTEDEIKSVKVYSITGKMVMFIAGSEDLDGIDVSNLSAGTYILSVQTTEEVLHTKIVKQ